MAILVYEWSPRYALLPIILAAAAYYISALITYVKGNKSIKGLDWDVQELIRRDRDFFE